MPIVNFSEDFKQACLQAIVDVIRQGKPSGYTSSNGKFFYCSYRANDGCKCLVGFMIPDEAYTIDIEEKSVNTDEVLEVLPFEGLFTDCEESKLLTTLQTCYDKAAMECHEKGGQLLFVETFKGKIARYIGSGELPNWIFDYKNLLTDDEKSV